MFLVRAIALAATETRAQWSNKTYGITSLQCKYCDYGLLDSNMTYDMGTTPRKNVVAICFLDVAA